MYTLKKKKKKRKKKKTNKTNRGGGGGGGGRGRRKECGKRLGQVKRISYKSVFYCHKLNISIF